MTGRKSSSTDTGRRRFAGPAFAIALAAMALAGFAFLVLSGRPELPDASSPQESVAAGEPAGGQDETVAGSAEQATPGEGTVADAAARLALGERVYVEACASCHGAALEGQPNWQSRGENGRLPAPPHDETGHSWHHPDEYLFLVTKYGVTPFAGPDYQSDMPAFEQQLSDDEIHSVIDYIKSRWPETIRARQAEIDAAARAQQ